MCFDYQNGVTNEEEDLMFASELELFSIGIISLPLETLEIVVINTVQTENNTKTINDKAKPSCNFKSSVEIVLENKPKVNLEDKVYLKTYYHHTLGQVQIEKMPTKIQVQELQIASWTLTK